MTEHLCFGCEFGLDDHKEGCVSRGKHESLNKFRSRILGITVEEVEKIIDEFAREQIVNPPERSA